MFGKQKNISLSGVTPDEFDENGRCAPSQYQQSSVILKWKHNICRHCQYKRKFHSIGITICIGLIHSERNWYLRQFANECCHCVFGQMCFDEFNCVFIVVGLVNTKLVKQAVAMATIGSLISVIVSNMAIYIPAIK